VQPDLSHVGKEAFIAALSDSQLQLEVMKQQPQNVDAALSHAIKYEAFEQSMASQGGVVNHNDGQLCSVVCTVAGPSEAGETAALLKLIGDLQDAMGQ